MLYKIGSLLVAHFYMDFISLIGIKVLEIK